MKYILVLDNRRYRVDSIDSFYFGEGLLTIRCGGETYFVDSDHPRLEDAVLGLEYMMAGEGYPEYCNAIGQRSARSGAALADIDKELP